MTQSELETGARLLAAATPGPWRAGRPNFCCLKHKIPHPGPPECEYTFQGWHDGTEIYRDQQPKHANDDSGLVAGMWDYEQGGIKRTEDAAAIAWLRTHAAELIADSVRLSWLDRGDVELHASTESGKPFVYIALATTGQQIAKGDTIRAAIDAVMGNDAVRAGGTEGA